LTSPLSTSTGSWFHSFRQPKRGNHQLVVKEQFCEKEAEMMSKEGKGATEAIKTARYYKRCRQWRS
jgi:hypothetical protein